MLFDIKKASLWVAFTSAAVFVIYLETPKSGATTPVRPLCSRSVLRWVVIAVAILLFGLSMASRARSQALDFFC
jgi:multisubunit Na+/H+ antiporter MnhC subunit